MAPEPSAHPRLPSATEMRPGRPKPRLRLPVFWRTAKRSLRNPIPGSQSAGFSKLLMRCPHFVLCTALLLACPPFVFAAADAGLFSADTEAAAPRPPAPVLHGGAPPQIGGRERALGEAPLHGEGRSRIAGVDSGRLAAARRDVERGSPARLSLNLFADTEFEAVMERTAPTASGYTLTGRLAGDPLSTVVLAVNGDLVAGTVWGADGFYAIRGGVRGASVRQLDPSDPSRKEVCEGGLSPSPSQDASPAPEAGRRAGRAGAWSADASAPVDDGSVIDVLVAYPRYIREHQGGHRACGC